MLRKMFIKNSFERGELEEVGLVVPVRVAQQGTLAELIRRINPTFRELQFGKQICRVCLH